MSNPSKLTVKYVRNFLANLIYKLCFFSVLLRVRYLYFVNIIYSFIKTAWIILHITLGLFVCLFSWRYNPFGCIFHSPVAGL